MNHEVPRGESRGNSRMAIAIVPVRDEDGLN